MAGLPPLPALGGLPPLPALGSNLGQLVSTGLPALPSFGSPAPASTGLPSLPALGGGLPSLPSLGQPAPVATGLPALPSLGQPVSTGLPSLPALGNPTPVSTGLPSLQALGQPVSTGLPSLPALGNPTPVSTGLPSLPAIGQPVSTGLPSLPGLAVATPVSTGLPSLPGLAVATPVSTGLPSLPGLGVATPVSTGLQPLPSFGSTPVSTGLPALPAVATPVSTGLQPLPSFGSTPVATGLPALPAVATPVSTGLQPLPSFGSTPVATGLPALPALGGGAPMAGLPALPALGGSPASAMAGPQAGLPPLSGNVARSVSIAKPVAVAVAVPVAVGPSTSHPSAVAPSTGPSLPALPTLGGTALPALAGSTGPALPTLAASTSATLPGLAPLPSLGAKITTVAPTSGMIDVSLPEPIAPVAFDYFKQPTPGMPVVPIHVSILDGTTAVINTTPDFTGSDLLVAFACQLQLFQHEFFHISFKDPEGEERWVEPNQTLFSQHVDSRTKCLVQIRYFKTPWRLVDPQLLYLYFLQVRHAVLGGEWWASSRITLRMAAYELQIYEGDAADQKTDPRRLQDLKMLLPQTSLKIGNLSEDDIRKRIRARWAGLSGQSVDVCAKAYMHLAEQIPVFGCKTFQLHDQVDPRKTYVIAIAEDGVLIHKEKRVWDFYSWIRISHFGVGDAEGTMTIQVSLKNYYFKANPLVIYNILHLLSGYYSILAAQPGSQLPSIELPISVTDFCDPRKYVAPRQLTRKGEMKNWSRLESFLSLYLKACERKSQSPIPYVIRVVEAALEANAPWRRLNFSDNPVAADLLLTFGEALKATSEIVPESTEFFDENIQFDEVDFSGLPLGTKCLEPLKLLLACHSIPILKLTLHRCQLTSKSCDLLDHCFQSNRTLQILDVSHNAIGDKGVPILLRSLKHNPATRRFVFKNCQCTDKVTNVIQLMIKNNPIVSELVLDQNAIRESGLKHMMVTLKFSKTFRALSLAKAMLTDASVKDLFTWMSQKPLIKQLNIERNSLGSSACKALNKYMETPNGIVSLQLGGNKFGGSEWKKFCASITDNKSLETLGISGIPTDKSTTPLLCDYVSRNTKIKHLDVSECFAKDPAGLGNFLDSAGNSSSLSRLDISHHDLSKGDIVQKLVNFINRSSSLRHLEIKNCNLSGSSLSAVCDAIGKSRGILIVDLSKNKISSGFEPIVSMISANKGLVAVHLRHSGVPIEFPSAVATAAKSCPKFRYLDLAHCRLEKNSSMITIASSAGLLRMRYIKL